MADGALSDVVVLELATGVAGSYCGKLLADLGAQVVKVEPPGGDPLRTAPPLAGGESAFFAWLNANKLGAALPLDDGAIDALAAHADIVIHGARGATAEALEARLAVAAPRATVLSLTPYGRSGPRAGWQATELTEWATGGYFSFAGDPAREPLALPGPQAEYHAGLHAASAALAGLRHARATGQGQRIEISHQEAVLSDHAWLTVGWTTGGRVQARTGSLYAKCADGYVYLFDLVPYPNLFVLIERFDLLEDESLQDALTWRARFPEIFAAFGAWAATRTKQEIYHAGQELRIPFSPVNTFEDVANSTQLAARAWFGEVAAGGKTFRAPGFPYRLSETPCAVQRPAPTLGEHTAEVAAPAFPWANAAVMAAPLAGPGDAPLQDPLDGIRVIEVTANWAGPAAGRVLGDLGADVIKVELATKPATRSFAWIANDETWPDHYNRSGYFNKLNRNKRDICLDLAKPTGKDVFLRLVAAADVVIENNAARVMGNLGLDYPALRAVNPRIVMCSMSGFGATGPERNYSAFGSNIETTSGLASVLGYGDGTHFGTGTFYADPVTGNHGATAILAALHARERTGEGQWIDMSLLEAVAPFFAGQFLQYTVEGRVPQPLANRSEVCVPQGAYPTAGRDCWLAVSVRDEADYRALCAVIGLDPLPAELAPGGAAARRQRSDAIDAAISRWAGPRNHVHAADLLQAAGVPAAPVMPAWEIFGDNHLNDRDFFVRVRQASIGTWWYAGFPWRLEHTPARVRLPAPAFAEHNQAVFGDLLGLSPTEVRALYDAGVTADEPQFAVGSL